MKFRTSVTRRSAIVSTLASLPLIGARADSFPDRPIRIVLPFPPAGSTDVVGRLLGKGLAANLGQPVIVENVAGAGGTIGMQQVVRAEAAGYTLAFTISGPVTLIPLVNKSVRYRMEDVEPLGIALESPLLLVVPANSPFKSLQQLIRAGQGDRSSAPAFGSSGVGSISHMASEMLNIKSGCHFLHVPYKGTAETILALLAGDVQWALVTGVDGRPPIADGRLRPLATLSSERSAAFPEIATAEELGVKGLSVNTWYGLFAPKAIPNAHRDRLNQALRLAITTPDYIAKVRSLGSSLPTHENTPESIKGWLGKERDDYAATAKAINFVAQ